MPAVEPSRNHEDVTEHKILAELYTRSGNAAEAVGRWRTII